MIGDRRCGWRAAVGLLSAAPLLAACSTPSWLCLAPPGPSTVTLVAAPNANNNAAIAVDLVLISDDLAAQQIAPLSAQDYFARRAQLMRDYGAGLQVRSWELAPGQIARDMPARPVCNRVKTLLFARYAAPGDHRQVLGTSNAIVVSLNADDFTVAP
jgi:type VI secretion system protein